MRKQKNMLVLPLLLVLASGSLHAVAAAADTPTPAARSTCSFPCSAHATCNEAERRCDCPPGMAGADCGVLAVPSCLMVATEAPSGSSPQAPPRESRSCACMREWVSLLNAQPAGVAWAADAVLRVACFDAPPGTPVLRVWELAAAAQLKQTLLSVSRPHTLAPLEVHTDEKGLADHNRIEVIPIERCQHNCSMQGFCQRGQGGLAMSKPFDDFPRCECWDGRHGVGCEKPAPYHPADLTSWCLNSCRGRGVCLRGTCACQRGHWGADCSLLATGAGGAEQAASPGGQGVRLMRGRGPALQPPTTEAPGVFVYDLPPSLVSWQLWLARSGMFDDWQRTAGVRFVEAALRSSHRVTAAADASIFIIPVAGSRNVHRFQAFEHIRRTYTHLNASVAAGLGPNHVWPIMPADSGVAEYSGMVSTLLSDGANGTLPSFFAHTIFLSHLSLHLGQSRGLLLANNSWWKDGEPPQPSNIRFNTGMHVPGKDVMAPIADKQDAQCMTAEAVSKVNKTHVLWWAGSVHRGGPSVRSKVANLFANTSGFAITTTGGVNDADGMMHSQFCLAPSGTGGSYGSRDARAVCRGCWPVYVQDKTSQPFEDLIPISLYGLAVLEADIEHLPQILEGALPDRARAREQLACACRALRWPWIGEEGRAWEALEEHMQVTLDREGAFASLLMLLERRRSGVGPLTDACAAVPPPVPPVPPPASSLVQPPLPPPTQTPQSGFLSGTPAGNNTFQRPLDCANFSLFLRSIHEDLMPWASTGITASMMEEARKYTIQGSSDHGLAFLLRESKLYIINGRREDVALNKAKYPVHGSIKFMLTYVRALAHLAATHGAQLPDVEFVVAQGDKGQSHFDLSKPDTSFPSWAARRSVPLMRYCKSDDSPEITVPYHHFYEKKVTADLINDEGIPWSQRKAELFGNHHGYSRIADSPSTVRMAADGGPLPEWARQSTRMYLKNVSAWAGNDTNVTGIPLQILTHSLQMRDWGTYKYILHIDGITCSSKLEQELPLGSLIFKEQSGYRSFFHRLLVPYEHYVPYWRHRPQELLDALAWAAAHEAEAASIAAAGRLFAKRYLHKRALTCYWCLLLTEYAKLQRFRPGAAFNTSQLVLAEEYLSWARESDNGTNVLNIANVLELDE